MWIFRAWMSLVVLRSHAIWEVLPPSNRGSVLFGFKITQKANTTLCEIREAAWISSIIFGSHLLNDFGIFKWLYTYIIYIYRLCIICISILYIYMYIYLYCIYILYVYDFINCKCSKSLNSSTSPGRAGQHGRLRSATGLWSLCHCGSAQLGNHGEKKKHLGMSENGVYPQL